MTTYDLASLPLPIAQYFATSGQGEAARLFAAEAVVVDEGRTHKGLPQIIAWLDDVEHRYHPRYRLKQASHDQQRHIVTFEVSGTFPGSPATLRQSFALSDDGKIAHLQTL